jgi:transposase-like protein
LESKTFEKLVGTIEADETYIGGKQRGGLRPGPHHGRKSRGPYYNKQIVLGILERGGHVRSFSIPDVKRKTVVPKIMEHVAAGSTIYTDEMNSYKILKNSFAHKVVNHAYEYVNGNVHTNGIESFLSLLKLCLKGTYIHADAMHLDRYVAEQVYRFNTKEMHDTSRFMKAVRSTTGKRLTYRELIKRWETPTT